MLDPVTLERILAGTPPWFFVLFAALIWLGSRRLRPRTVALRRVWLIPGIFLIWGVAGVAVRSSAPSTVVPIWLAAAVAAGALGVLTNPRPLAVDRANGLVSQRGSWLPLVRILIIVLGHYVLNVAMAIRPDQRAVLALWDVGVSGAGAGFFIGWGARFAVNLRHAPEAELRPVPILDRPPD